MCGGGGRVSRAVGDWVVVTYGHVYTGPTHSLTHGGNLPLSDATTHFVLLHQVPVASAVGVGGRALEHERGGAVAQWP